MDNSNTLIKSNYDFLFIYEAINCNPNGDPDQENKPRMDYENDINLVTDVRLKRYIRDYFKIKGKDIFVDLEGDSKVSPSKKLESVLYNILSDEKSLENLLSENEEYLKYYKALINEFEGNIKKVITQLTKKKADLTQSDKKKSKTKKDNEDREENETDVDSSDLIKKRAEFNNYLLSQLIKQKFIDIRLFGSAFAIGGFNKSYTGPVQINWGYSLNKVSLIDSNSIVTIMNDEESTFGKDYRLYYSLIAFNGSINKNAAKFTNLTEQDLKDFRDAIWNCIPALATRSKFNQYPKLYLEIEYNNNFNNGYFGDLRNYIKVSPKDNLNFEKVRKFDDLNINFDNLTKILDANKGDNKAIKNIYVKKSDDISLSL